MLNARSKAGAAALAAVVGLVFLGITAGPAGAHEVRKVGGYELTVGWQREPTYTGVVNGVQFFVKDAKGNPVDDLGDPPSLKVDVTTGGKTSDPLDIKASFDPDTGEGTHGEFDAALIPTSPGDYTFHFTGNIKGQNIDEKFTSSDTTFETVKDPTAIQFPSKEPSPGQLATSVNRLDPRVKNATDKAKSASTLAIVALVVGAVLGIGGIAVGATARRRS